MIQRVSPQAMQVFRTPVVVKSSILSQKHTFSTGAERAGLFPRNKKAHIGLRLRSSSSAAPKNSRKQRKLFTSVGS